MRRLRAGFSLLEVMVAIAVLLVSLVLLMEIQSSAIKMTSEAQRFVVATGLAQEKLTEVLLLVEEEGFGTDDIHEHGDFDDFGDEAVNLEFGESLEEYHWEYWVEEIDLGLAGDLTGMAGDMAGSGYWGDEGSADIETPDSQAPDLSTLGVSSDMITDMLGAYIREVRVRVYWGKSSRLAEKLGDEIIITTHVINPTGQVIPGSEGTTDGGSSTSAPTNTPTVGVGR